MPNLSELLAQKAELDKLIAETRNAERAQAIAQVKTLMAQYGLSVADIGAHSDRGNGAPRSLNKAPVKYRDPATGQTWSGRGLQPNWLKAALASGRTLQDFSV